MTRTSKLYDRLDLLEDQLCAELSTSLTETHSSGYCAAFDRPEYSVTVSTWWANRPVIREIIGLVDEIEALRKKLGEPVDDGIVGRYRFWADHHHSSDENRLGPKRLANAFLQEIRDLSDHKDT